MTLTKPFTSQINTSDIASTSFATKASVDSVQGNVTALSANVGGGGGDASNAWVNANDYVTLLTAQANDGVTLATARGNDHSTLLSARANDWATFNQVTANIYNTYISLFANINTAAGTFEGTLAGYTSGGYIPPTTNTIDKFPFSIDTNATDVGDLTQARTSVAGQSSSLSGYSSGGQSPSAPMSSSNRIDKFPFATNGNATTVGSLTQIRQNLVGQNSLSTGYSSGGSGPSPSQYNIVDKFPFSADASATDVGDLTVPRLAMSGQSSSESGYTSGGTTEPFLATTNVIDKFPFASNANSTDVGDLTQSRGYVAAGHSSSVSGYVSGGVLAPFPASLYVNTIDKFPFAANGNASDVGDLSVTRSSAAGQSSSTSGYTSGGFTVSSRSNVIDKFPFASNANALDVGDLSILRGGPAGQQI